MVVETGHIFSNILQAITKIIQNHSLAILQPEKLHCNLLQAKSSCSLQKTEMTNLAENNRNLPKPSLADHCVAELPSKRASVDVNTLLSQSNYVSFNRGTVNCGIGGNKTQNNLWRSNNIPLPQALKYVVINCGTNKLDTDNPDEISDRLICIALVFQKRLKHLQIIVDGFIPHDATNTRQRQKLLEVN